MSGPTSDLSQELSLVTPSTASNDPTGVSSANVRAWTRRPRKFSVPESVTAREITVVAIPHGGFFWWFRTINDYLWLFQLP